MIRNALDNLKKKTLLRKFQLDDKWITQMGFFLQLLGVLFAPSSPKNWKDFNDVVKFIEFEHVTGLYIRGFGLIDGRGKGWWDISCRYHPDLKVHQILFFSPQAYIVIRNSDFPAMYTFGNFKISSKLFFTQKKL